MSYFWIYYLVLINLWAFFIMGSDKLKAKKKKRRIPERQLFFYAFLGGSLGMFTGMRVFRHKTQHPSFQYGVPAFFVFNVVAVVFLLKLF